MKRDSELYPYRRHLTRCKFFGPGGRGERVDRCDCPFHVDGRHNGHRIRQSLRTRNRQHADRRLTALLRTLDAKLDHPHTGEGDAALVAALPAQRTVSEAVDRFLKRYGEIDARGKYDGLGAHSTFRKYKNSLTRLVSFCTGRAISAVAAVGVDALEDFRRTRHIRPRTWKVERQTLVTFFNYCVQRKWITTNPARELKAPRNLAPNDVVPYTLQEESLILAACDRIGGGRYERSGATYERLRARAMVGVIRHAALRVSDAYMLRKDAISWDQDKTTWRIFLRTQKSGEPVYLPIPADLKLVLDALPLPRNAAKDCPYYFWNGHTSRRAGVGIAERTLAAVFKKSGVKDAHAHRFRHTLATRLLGEGATFEQVADILGNSPDVVREHYGKWSKGRQDNIDRLMFAHFKTASVSGPVTQKSHEKTGAVN